MKTGRNIWYRVGHTQQTLRPTCYSTLAHAEQFAARVKEDVWSLDYHGVIGEMPSARNKDRKPT